MIVVDTSALIAILERESDAALFADPPLISAATQAETAIVMLHRRGLKAGAIVGALIREAGRIHPPAEFSPCDIYFR
jgi:uncharacterized protein with PIN domain